MPASRHDATDPINGWSDERGRPPAERETLEDYRARHEEACGGTFREEYVRGRFAGTGHYRYVCDDCKESYGTDSSG